MPTIAEATTRSILVWGTSRLQLVIANCLLVDNHGIRIELDEGRILPLTTIYHVLYLIAKVYHSLS